MKNFLKIIVALILSSSVYSQNAYASIITKEGNTMAKAMLNKNYSTMIDYTYPEIIKMAGGREKLLTLLESTMEGMSKQGYNIEKITLGEPQKIFTAGKELHCLISETLLMSTTQGKAQITNYLLCISKDNGKNWCFLESSKLTPENIKKIFPNFNTALKIPEKGSPKIISE